MTPPRAAAGVPHEEHDGALTVARFALSHSISRAQAYKEIAAGRLTARKVGSRTIITSEDAAAWRRALPKATPAAASPRGHHRARQRTGEAEAEGKAAGD
jgi:hypothetical protein